MRKCANCGERYPINDTRCPECDTHAPAGKKDDVQADPVCAYNDHGVKCKKLGTLSPSTSGIGPWYCRGHAWVFLHDRALFKPRLVPSREPGQDEEEQPA